MRLACIEAYVRNAIHELGYISSNIYYLNCWSLSLKKTTQEKRAKKYRDRYSFVFKPKLFIVREFNSG
jgi:hypothetical protein